MDDSSIDTKSRRAILKSAALLAGVATIRLLANTRNVFADGKLAKADVKYQGKSNAGKDCDDCLQFIAAATSGANGTCKVVEGPISPHGYCIAFASKPKRR
jgi:hypothetical protein